MRNVINEHVHDIRCGLVGILRGVSLVDVALRAGSDFAEMDFPTRDRYRHAIEELARRSGRTELEVANRAVAAAKHAAELGSIDLETAGSHREAGYFVNQLDVWMPTEPMPGNDLVDLRVKGRLVHRSNLVETWLSNFPTTQALSVRELNCQFPAAEANPPPTARVGVYRRQIFSLVSRPIRGARTKLRCRA